MKLVFAVGVCSAWWLAWCMPAHADAPAPKPARSPYAHGYPYAREQRRADDFFPTERSGLAFALGLGTSYVNFGGHVEYQIIPPEQRLTIAPYVGAGVSPSSSDHDAVWSGTFGIMLMRGLTHRWVLDASYGYIGAVSVPLHGVPGATRGLYGPSLLVGRDWMWGPPVFLRLLVGLSYCADPHVEEARGFSLGLSIALGVKP
jgi:hypothetical protein